MATALFVIDIQNDLATDPETRVPHSQRIRAAGEKILATARTIHAARDDKPGSPRSIIVFVQHEEKPEDGPLVRGTEPWQLVFEPDRDAPR
jgi:nicotinamidase-related amidase